MASQDLALGVDLAYLSTGLALVSLDSVLEFRDIKIPQGSLFPSHQRLMEQYHLMQPFLEVAPVIFIEVPSTGMLARYLRERRTRIEAIEHLAMALLSLEIALDEIRISDREIYYLDPGRLSIATVGTPAIPGIIDKFKELGLKDAKLSRRAWLYHVVPGTDWLDPKISDHISDAAFTGIIGLQIWRQGEIESFVSRQR